MAAYTPCALIGCDSQKRLLPGFQFARCKSVIISKPLSTKTTIFPPHGRNGLQSAGIQSESLLLSTTPIDTGLSPEVNIIVFIIGLIPFLWATFEFWRRIAVGEAFGTGKDSVIIGKDMEPSSSRGRRTLGRGALVTAYFLFGIAIVTLAIVLYSVLSTGF